MFSPPNVLAGKGSAFWSATSSKGSVTGSKLNTFAKRNSLNVLSSNVLLSRS